MSPRLKQKRVLITGASRGIGFGIAKAFAAEGANLILNARDHKRLEAAAKELRESSGVTVEIAPCDVTDQRAVEDMVETAFSTGPVDVLVNNAGVYKPQAFVDYTMEDFRDIFEVNVFAVIALTQLVLRKMLAAKSGNIVNVASTAGKWGSRNQSAYNMSKHALVGMTRCLALEMAPHQIRVNALCPWIVDTDLADTFVSGHAEILDLPEATVATNLKSAIPLHSRWIKPEEVASLAVFLASDESTYVTGQAWTIDGGYTMI